MLAMDAWARVRTATEVDTGSDFDYLLLLFDTVRQGSSKVEQRSHNPLVGGSSPSPATTTNTCAARINSLRRMCLWYADPLCCDPIHGTNTDLHLNQAERGSRVHRPTCALDPFLEAPVARDIPENGFARPAAVGSAS